jgi:hypothetical protein
MTTAIIMAKQLRTVPIITQALSSESSAWCWPGAIGVTSDAFSLVIEAVAAFAVPSWSDVVPGRNPPTRDVLTTVVFLRGGRDPDPEPAPDHND